jgi:hypothetical protein
MRQGKDGQAVIEYVLTLLIALSILSVVIYGFNSSLRKTWRAIALDIAKACPKCPAPR